MAEEGASENERLLAAARTDNEDLILEVFATGKVDINCTDSVGNTALHLAILNGSTIVLEEILSYEGCDVDPINRIEKATPLHLIFNHDDPELRRYLAASLLEAGADTTIKDGNGDTVLDLASRKDPELKELILSERAQTSISHDDIADDDDDDDDYDGSGSDDD